MRNLIPADVSSTSEKAKRVFITLCAIASAATAVGLVYSKVLESPALDWHANTVDKDLGMHFSSILFKGLFMLMAAAVGALFGAMVGFSLTEASSFFMNKLEKCRENFAAKTTAYVAIP